MDRRLISVIRIYQIFDSKKTNSVELEMNFLGVHITELKLGNLPLVLDEQC